MIWYVHRRADKSIASAYEEKQPGYAEEALDDAKDAEMIAFREMVAPKDPMPLEVTAPQLVRALFDIGLYDKAQEACEKAGGLVYVLWERAPIFTRADPMVEAIGAAVGLDTKQIDDVFRVAGKYK